MTVAVRYDEALVGPDGRVAGHDAGSTLVRRLLRVFPGSFLVGPGPRRYPSGLEVLPLELIDAGTTVVLTMDVVDSVTVWQTLHARCAEPKVMNFVWWSTSRLEHPVQRAAMGLSCALFPTFANSQRTASEVREVVATWTVPHLAEKAQVAWVNLGVRLEHVQPRVPTDVPVVLYPAIYLSARKRPELFVDVVERVARRTPIRVEARLHESHLVSEDAMRLSSREWAWVGPLTASREDYWHALARTTAFLATASEESYGLSYVEALMAGAIGVFPDRPWVHALVPDGYPWIYRDAHEAEEMLMCAVTDPQGCRRELDATVPGEFTRWWAERHDDSVFDAAITGRVREWFGADASP